MSTPTTTRPAPGVGGGPQQAPGALSRVLRWSPPGQYLPVIATGVLFLAMFGAGGLRYEGFTDPQNFLSLFLDNAFLIVLAVGMTFVILTGGIDLSVGSVVALSTMIAAKTLEAGWSVPAAMVAVLVVATALGLLMGVLVHHLQIQPFIATLAGLFLARGICFMISAESVPITDPEFLQLSFTPITLPGGYFIRWSVVIALLVVAVAVWVLARTRFGRTVYAVGSNESSALLMGLAVGRTKVAVYAISGFCAGVAGILFTLYTPSGNSLHAVGMELDAIAAVVIGGTLLTGGRGLVLGSVLGVLVLGTIKSFIVFENLNSWWTRIVVGVLVLVFVVIQRLLTRRRA